MSLPDIKYSSLKMENGLEVMISPMPESPTVTILMIFKVGSRDESKDISGISHFLEHIVFKGNKSFPNAKEIAAAIESLGGAFNAFTSKEYTGFYVKVGSKFLKTALNWLGALVASPIIREKDVDAERNVIFEEINMYSDTPSRQVGDLFEELLFSNHSLGRNILGTKKSLEKINSKKIKDYFSKYYTPSQSLLIIAGDLNGIPMRSKYLQKRWAKKYISKSFSFANSGSKEKIENKEIKSSRKIIDLNFKQTDQTHLILGAQTFSLFDRKRYPLTLISTLLGGGMSSWSYEEIREKRGLAYYVYSSPQLYEDVGYLSLNAGVNNKNVFVAIKEMKKLFDRLRNRLVSQAELKRAKDQVVGSMLLERETSSNIAFLLGSEMVSRGEVIPFSKEIETIRKIDRDDLKKLAQEFFKPEQLRLSLIGPWKKEEEKKFLNLLK